MTEGNKVRVRVRDDRSGSETRSGSERWQKVGVREVTEENKIRVLVRGQGQTRSGSEMTEGQGQR